MVMKVSAFGHFIEKLVELLFCCLSLKVFKPISRHDARGNKQEQEDDKKLNIQLDAFKKVTAPQGWRRRLEKDYIRSPPMRASTIIKLESGQNL